ncbi:MAG: aspartate/glutamate racemase family protein [Minisyncoccia bacterium]
MKKILDLLPIPKIENLESTLKDRKDLSQKISALTNFSFQLDIELIKKGSVSIEGAYDEVINSPYIIETIKEIGNNYDAIIIDCFLDPSLEAAREITKVPVIGENEASTHLASQISSKFSIINVIPETENLIYKILKKNGLSDNLASIITINIPVLSLEKNMDRTIENIVKSIEKAVYEDKAQSIIFGCTGMSSLLEKVKEKLKIEIPIVDPLRAGIYTAISWILLGITQSPIAYMPPRKKERIY